jgi:hypothetical protein
MSFCRIAVRSDGRLILGAQSEDNILLEPGAIYEICGLPGDDTSLVLRRVGVSAATGDSSIRGLSWGRDVGSLVMDGFYLLTEEEHEKRREAWSSNGEEKPST